MLYIVTVVNGDYVAWDVHIKKVLNTGMKKVNQLREIISNRNINLSTLDCCCCLY